MVHQNQRSVKPQGFRVVRDYPLLLQSRGSRIVDVCHPLIDVGAV